MTETEMPKFATACILSYERPLFLRQALATLTEHADFPLEVIVHDDGSRDPDVHNLLSEALEQGLVSTVIRNPPGHNQGQGVALNRMFMMAKGDPIIKLDQDLIFQPEWLRRCVEVIQANKQEFVEGTIEKSIGVLGLFKYPAEPVRYEDMFIRDWGHPDYTWEEHEDFVGSALVVPRDVWEAFGPFEEGSDAFAEDREFKMRVKNEGGLALALIKGDDLAVNQGFGVGPSTVVIDHGTVAPIHHGPVVIGDLGEAAEPTYVRDLPIAKGES